VYLSADKAAPNLNQGGCMDNLHIYNKVKAPPKNALKPITGGRLINKTDINPMWRIRTLTEQFGPCGIGWYPVIVKKWLEKADNGEVAAFVDIELFIKVDGEWSKPIPGTGGSMLVANEKSGPYVCDDCYKMAYTDAISVACKALGIAADIYWANNETKYGEKNNPQPSDPPGEKKDPKKVKIDAVKIQTIEAMMRKTETQPDDVLGFYGLKCLADMTVNDFMVAMGTLEAKQRMTEKKAKKPEEGKII